jgi:hypothetical protein
MTKSARSITEMPPERLQVSSKKSDIGGTYYGAAVEGNPKDPVHYSPQDRALSAFVKKQTPYQVLHPPTTIDRSSFLCIPSQCYLEAFNRTSPDFQPPEQTDVRPTSPFAKITKAERKMQAEARKLAEEQYKREIKMAEEEALREDERQRLIAEANTPPMKPSETKRVTAKSRAENRLTGAHKRSPQTNRPSDAKTARSSLERTQLTHTRSSGLGAKKEEGKKSTESDLFSPTPRKISPFKPKKRLLLTKEEVKHKTQVWKEYEKVQALAARHRVTADLTTEEGGMVKSALQEAKEDVEEIMYRTPDRKKLRWPLSTPYRSPFDMDYGEELKIPVNVHRPRMSEWYENFGGVYQ